MLAAEKRTGVPVLLGYTWRWWPPLRRLRALLEEKTIGTVRHVQFPHVGASRRLASVGAYQEFFMASAAPRRRRLARRKPLDRPHGLAVRQAAAADRPVEKISDLDIDADDNVDVLAAYENGLARLAASRSLRPPAREVHPLHR
jgi:predicted dehydrogenase